MESDSSICSTLCLHDRSAVRGGGRASIAEPPAATTAAPAFKLDEHSAIRPGMDAETGHSVALWLREHMAAWGVSEEELGAKKIEHIALGTECGSVCSKEVATNMPVMRQLVEAAQCVESGPRWPGERTAWSWRALRAVLLSDTGAVQRDERLLRLLAQSCHSALRTIVTEINKIHDTDQDVSHDQLAVRFALLENVATCLWRASDSSEGLRVCRDECGLD